MSVRDHQFIFLGTGTSAGVPVIACDCRVCTSHDPRDKRTRTGACLRFTDGNGEPRTILIDATPDLRAQALRHKLTRCDAILFTHNHVDHTFGLDEVRRFNAVMRAPIDIYADGHTMETLFRIYRHIFEREKNINDSFVATLLPHLIDPDKPLRLFGLEFTPLHFLHGGLPVLGFRIEEGGGGGNVQQSTVNIQHSTNGSLLPLAYCTDVSHVPPETWPRLEGLGTLVLDMLRYRAHQTHLTVDQAISIAERVGAKRTYFVHMTHDILHAELDAELPESMSLAYDGLTLFGGQGNETRRATEGHREGEE